MTHQTHRVILCRYRRRTEEVGTQEVVDTRQVDCLYYGIFFTYLQLSSRLVTSVYRHTVGL